MNKSFEVERYKVRESKADLAKELENETARREQVEEAYERLKEELIK